MCGQTVNYQLDNGTVCMQVMVSKCTCVQMHTQTHTHTSVVVEVTGWIIPVYLALEIKARLEKHKKCNNTLKMLLCWAHFCFRFNHIFGIIKLAKCCLFCHYTPIFVPLERNFKTSYPSASLSNVWINRVIKSQNKVGWRGSLEVICGSPVQGWLRALFSWVLTVPKAEGFAALQRSLFWCCSSLWWTYPEGLGPPRVPPVAKTLNSTDPR